MSCFILGIYYFKQKFFIAFLFCILSFGVSDLVSTRIFKNGFKRLRPCHNPLLSQKVYLAGQNCWGGKYGFVSSHAANTFTVAMFFWLLFRRKNRFIFSLFFYATLVSYSRVYLARHYPGDILVGALLGLSIGYIGFKAYIKIKNHFSKFIYI
ncbi:MAG: phosphatase PAP2 family protein [Halobacteriovoraceae bacterium]|nr:phosphatase PAP2 family protein [Halobacteriovoraceae bacterium]